MKKPWSISTTIRNPLRLRDILKVLALLEGESFDTENQIKFQILLIQHRLYRPSDMSDAERAVYEDPERDFPFDLAAEIFHHQQYKEPAMRGRQSANPLNKLGFAIARGTSGPISVTELGRRFLEGSRSVETVFLESLSKLQFPNPLNRDFKTDDGFNIRPLIGTLQFIEEANSVLGDEGLTSTEFGLFVPTLINYRQKGEWIQKLREYRAAEDKKRFIERFAREFYGRNPTKKDISNFHEYGDNTMRYFRMTRLFRVTRSSFGAEWRINTEPLRAAEIRSILSTQTPEAKEFAAESEYIDYLNADDRIGVDLSVAREVRGHIESRRGDFPMEREQAVEEYLAISIDDNVDIASYIEKGRELLREATLKEQEQKLRHDGVRLGAIIDQLADSKRFKALDPEELEYLTTQALQIIDDEEKIIPYYLADDTGMPIGHAPGKKPDIEAFYSSFNAIIEVTKSTSSHQWVMETAPVMRHLQEFTARNTALPVYCLFLAPSIHTDTGHQFFFANSQGYNGQPQRIAPFTIKQFVNILQGYRTAFSQGIVPTHSVLRELLQSIVSAPASSHSEWLAAIDTLIAGWTPAPTR